MSGQEDYVLVPREPTDITVVPGQPGSDYAAAAHPQPSGDGALQNALDEGARLYPAGPYSTPFSAEALKHAFGLLQATPTDEWRRAVEACARVLDQRSDNEVKAAQECRHQMIPDDTLYIYAARVLAEVGRQIRALSPTKPDDGWRTMESAPKDGTRILLYAPKERYYRESNTFGPEQIVGRWGLPGEWYAGSSNNHIRGITRWRPLPAPPHTKEGE